MRRLLTATTLWALATFACGQRAAPEAVLLTWRAAAHRADGAAAIVGTAVAIEFVPRGYTP